MNYEQFQKAVEEKIEEGRACPRPIRRQGM